MDGCKSHPLRRRLATVVDEDDRMDAATARKCFDPVVATRRASKAPGLPQFTALRQGMLDGSWERALYASEVLVPTLLRWLENSRSGKQSQPLAAAEIVRCSA